MDGWGLFSVAKQQCNVCPMNEFVSMVRTDTGMHDTGMHRHVTPAPA
jgi:hypothetical protein